MKAFALLFWLLALLAPLGGLQAQSSNVPADDVTPLSAGNVTDLRGHPVYDTQGRKLGKVRDVVVDFTSGEVNSVVVASGFMGRQKKILPIGTVQLQAVQQQYPNLLGSQAAIRRIESNRIRHVYQANPMPGMPPVIRDEDRLASTVPKQRFDNAPNLAGKTLAPSTLEPTFAYYGETMPGTMVAATPANPSQPGEPALTPTGRSDTTPQPRLHLGRDLIGREVYNTHGERVGRVTDIRMNFQRSARDFAIVNVSNITRPEATKYLVDLRAFRSSPTGQELLLDAEWQLFQKADLYLNGTPEPAGREIQIYRYE